MNSYKRSLDLELVGDDDEKVAALQSLTLRDISKDDAGRFLREEKLLKYNGSKWIGTIEDLLDMGRISSEHVDDIDDLKSVLIGSGGTATVNWSGNRTIGVQPEKITFTPPPAVSVKYGVLSYKTSMKQISVKQGGKQIEIEFVACPNITVNFK